MKSKRDKAIDAYIAAMDEKRDAEVAYVRTFIGRKSAVFSRQRVTALTRMHAAIKELAKIEFVMWKTCVPPICAVSTKK